MNRRNTYHDGLAPTGPDWWQITLWSALLIALVLSAYAMASALGTQQHTWLGWLALLPFFAATRFLSPLAAAACGSCWGLALYALLVIRADVGVALTILSLVLLAAVPGLYAGAGALLTRRLGFSPFLLALGWIGVELALQPLALERGLLAGTQGEALVTQRVCHLLGYVFVAFALAYVNAWLVAALSGGELLPARAGRIVEGERRDACLLHPSSLAPPPRLVIRSLRPRAPPFASLRWVRGGHQGM
ncbi:MAG: hypothetical protein KKB50_09890 [Planctomycetes bacterium]|nr:hypothetical protein [Planctomycetota bacterium]